MSNILNDAAEFRKIKVTRLGRVGREHLKKILNNKMFSKIQAMLDGPLKY